MENTKNNIITKKDLFRASYRWMLGSQICWNYERMMSTGYIYTMLPFLEKKYGDNKEQLKEMLETHNQFFNCNPMMGHFIVGMDLAIEEQEGFESKEVITDGFRIDRGLHGTKRQCNRGNHLVIGKYCRLYRQIYLPSIRLQAGAEVGQ